jgi:Ca2+-binding EF-hand superfamily protein
MTRKAIALIAASFVVFGTISTEALADRKFTAAHARSDVRHLLSLLDKDKNGVVSRDEFLEFMGQTFDRVAPSNTGTIGIHELRRIPLFWVGRSTAAHAESDVRHLLRLMDEDKNGVASRDEFLEFMGQTFDRLDVNKSGTLETKELYPLTKGFPLGRW